MNEAISQGELDIPEMLHGSHVVCNSTLKNVRVRESRKDNILCKL